MLHKEYDENKIGASFLLLEVMRFTQWERGWGEGRKEMEVE